MSSGGGAPGPHKKARIEIIPLIDIMFFLLASFMLVSLSLVKLQGAKVDLPSAGKPLVEDIKKPDFTTISVDKEGKLYWINNGSKDKEEITMIDLGKRARELYNKGKQTGQEAKIFIAGDERVNYGIMLGIMDKLRKSGLTKVTFAVKSPSPGAAAADASGGEAPAPNP